MNPLTLVRRTQNIIAKEAELGISDEASWHANYKDSAYVFVGGIPYDLTEGDLLAVFAQEYINKLKAAVGENTTSSIISRSLTSWFAAKCDLILLLFDPHKLDVSDEFKRVISSLRGHNDKIRVVLNKADQVDTQQLMRIYGALMWSLSKVLNTPEVTRVYVGGPICSHKDHDPLLLPCDRTEVNRALKLYSKMEKENCKLDRHTYNMLLKMFIRIGRFYKVEKVWDSMPVRGFYPSVSTYAVMIYGFLKKKNKLEEACKYFEIMIDEGIPPYPSTLELLRNRLIGWGILDKIEILDDKMNGSSSSTIKDMSMTMRGHRSSQKRIEQDNPELSEEEWPFRPDAT